MSVLRQSAAFTEQLLGRLRGQAADPAAVGDFVAVCTDRPGDVWELFPVSDDGLVDWRGLWVEGEDGGLLAVSAINEREDAVIAVPAAEFADLAPVRALCWIPVTGLAPLRARLHRLRGAS